MEEISVHQEILEEDILTDDNYNQYFTFYLGDELFGVDISSVKEVVKFEKIFRIPLMPDVICGVVNIRGMIIPVVDLSERLYNHKFEINNNTHIAIFEIDDENESILVGLMIDDVNAVIDIIYNDIEANPEFGAKIRSSFIKNIAKVNNDFVMLLDLNNILSIDELSMIDDNDFNITRQLSTDEAVNKGIDFAIDTEHDEDILKEVDYVTFTLGDGFYGIETLKVKEIIEIGEITHVPNAMPFMKGVVNLRGLVVPLIDMRIRCSLEDTDYTKSASILIVEIKEILIGLIVDSVSDVITLKQNDIQNTPHFSTNIDKDFIEAIAKVDEKLYIMLDANKILTDEELDIIENQEQDNNQ